ncbi:hypothetical protein OK016_19425 [Vibrio chagasii]|nr:hypothetical protein [Vibrio chagasii]
MRKDLQQQATTTINDDSDDHRSLSADASVTEGEHHLHGRHWTNPADGARVTVTLSNGATITIADGATCGTTPTVQQVMMYT